MVRRGLAAWVFGFAATASAPALAQAPTAAVTYEQALASARTAAPEIAVAHGQERVAATEVNVARIYPNPAVSVGTSTQTARLSAGVSIPLILFGQRGAAADASRAELATVQVETQATSNDVRTAAAKAFIDLWLAQQTAAARADGAAVAQRIEVAVQFLVEKGKSPETDALRVHAERLRADADAQAAEGFVDVAASELARWMGVSEDVRLRAQGDPPSPASLPTVADLAARVDGGPLVRRELADANAAEARARRERVFVRPALAVDLGVEAWDYSLLAPGQPGPPPNNYRAGLTLDVPIFNQRGALIDREETAADAARTRAGAERTRQLAALLAAYRTFVAVSARAQALEQGVVPAAEEAAKRTEASHELGYAPLFAVLDADKAWIDARVQLLEAKAARAAAWQDVLHATGGSA